MAVRNNVMVKNGMFCFCFIFYLSTTVGYTAAVIYPKMRRPYIPIYTAAV
jgi:hypothetical protein